VVGKTASNPFHPSRGLLATNPPVFPHRLQLSVPLGLNLLLMPGEHVLGRDVSDGSIQAHIVVMLHVTLHQTTRIFKRKRRAGADASTGHLIRTSHIEDFKNYSYLSAIIGSTRIARRAGI